MSGRVPVLGKVGYIVTCERVFWLLYYQLVMTLLRKGVGHREGLVVCFLLPCRLSFLFALSFTLHLLSKLF